MLSTRWFRLGIRGIMVCFFLFFFFLSSFFFLLVVFYFLHFFVHIIIVLCLFRMFWYRLGFQWLIIGLVQ